MEEALRQSDLLRDVTDEQADLIAEIARFQTLRPNEYLFLLGQSADRVYVILSGRMEVCLPLSVDHEMTDVVVESFDPGHSLGWSGLVKPHRFTLSARAAEPTELAAFARPQLYSVFHTRPEVGLVVMERVAEMVGRRLLTTRALWARELQRVVSSNLDQPGDGEELAPDLR